MIKIITDSTCDIPQSLVEQYDIGVVPLRLTIDGQQYRDGVDIHPKEFYARLASNHTTMHTSQATGNDFKEVYDHAADTGADELLVMTLSSVLSGTYNSASQAAQDYRIPVTVVDTHATSMGMGWQVLAAARAREAGGQTVQGILENINRVRKKISQMVGMETLEYMQRGGRLGAAAKWAGSLLRIKPIVAFDHRDSRVEPVGLARSYRALVDLLHRQFFSRFKGKKLLRVAVLHGDAADTAQEMAEKIRAEYDPLELLVNSTNTAMGIHTGPGAVGLCGYSED